MTWLAWWPLAKFKWEDERGGSYLFHVPVVHGVVWHLVRLQLDDLLELVAVAFPLADYDHFVKQEDVPEGGGGARLRTGCCSSTNERHSWLCASVFFFFFCPWIFYSPVLLGPVDDGADLQLPVDLRPAVLLQLDLLLRSQGQHMVSILCTLRPLNLTRTPLIFHGASAGK